MAEMYRALGVSAVVRWFIEGLAVEDRRVDHRREGNDIEHVSGRNPPPAAGPRTAEWAFPSYPHPSDALVIDARVDPVPGGGTYSSATIVVERDTGRVFDWYRQALRDDGWRVFDESQLNQVRRLKASTGGTTLDLLVQVHPDYPGSGWTRVVAFVLERA